MGEVRDDDLSRFRRAAWLRLRSSDVESPWVVDEPPPPDEPESSLPEPDFEGETAPAEDRDEASDFAFEDDVEPALVDEPIGPEQAETASADVGEEVAAPQVEAPKAKAPRAKRPKKTAALAEEEQAPASGRAEVALASEGDSELGDAELASNDVFPHENGDSGDAVEDLDVVDVSDLVDVAEVVLEPRNDAPQEPSEGVKNHLRGLLEALIFASEHPMSLGELTKAAKADRKLVKELLGDLTAHYRERGMRLDEVGGGFMFRTSVVYAPFIRDVSAKKPVRMSRAQLETLALVAYRQPITRPEVDDVRGVDSGAALKSLLERDFVRILGKKEEPGRPMLYGTTAQFLEFFGMKALADLPTLREFTELTDESRRTYERETGEDPPDLGPQPNVMGDGLAGEGAMRPIEGDEFAFDGVDAPPEAAEEPQPPPPEAYEDAELPPDLPSDDDNLPQNQGEDESDEGVSQAPEDGADEPRNNHEDAMNEEDQDNEEDEDEDEDEDEEGEDEDDEDDEDEDDEDEDEDEDEDDEDDDDDEDEDDDEDDDDDDDDDEDDDEAS